MSTPMAVMDGMDGVVRPTAAGRMDGVGPALALSACACGRRIGRRIAKRIGRRIKQEHDGRPADGRATLHCR